MCDVDPEVRLVSYIKEMPSAPVPARRALTLRPADN